MADHVDPSITATIHCQFDGPMEILEGRASTDGEGVAWTTECEECRELGGYNAETLDRYGTVDKIQVIGE